MCVIHTPQRHKQCDLALFVSQLLLNVEKNNLPLLPVSGEDELSSPSQDASGLEEVMEQLNNSFPHSQGTTTRTPSTRLTRQRPVFCGKKILQIFLSCISPERIEKKLFLSEAFPRGVQRKWKSLQL